MTRKSIELGGRIPLTKPNELTPVQQSLYDDIDTHQVPWAEAVGFVAKVADGSLIGPFNVVLQSPEIVAAFGILQSVEAKNTTLSERVRQVVILTVGSIWKSQYELYAYKAAARKAGITEEAIDALVTGRPSESLTDEEKRAQAFAEEITRNHRVSKEMFDQLKATFGIRGIVDILFLAGCYDIVCSLLNAFEVPVPEDSAG
ncbi:MAG: carboxymuconolactone decarboxylase family protein [Nostoc sp.]